MIADVVRGGLCTQCCFCAALCPVEAILMQWDDHGNIFPWVCPECCTRCGLCLEICSGHAFSFDDALKPILPGNGAGVLSPLIPASCVEPSGRRDCFAAPTGCSRNDCAPRGSAAVPPSMKYYSKGGSPPSAPPHQKILLGEYRSLWLGHAADDGLRSRAASGGMVSALLAGALDSGLAGKVLVVPPPDDSVWLARARLAATPGEARAAAGSWYLPVSFEAAVREVAEGAGRVAVAGLPCHIQAWRKAASAVPGLGEKVALTVGLFCDHLVDTRFWELALDRLGVDTERIAGIRFRGGGWPGTIRVRLDDGREKTFPYDNPLRKVLWKSYLYTPRRCLYCYDALAEFADISVGDPWRRDSSREGLGDSVVMARTERGESFLRDLAGSGAVSLEPLAEERLSGSQRVQLTMKKREIGARASLARAFGRAVPDWGVPLPRPSLRGRLLGGGVMALSALSRSRLGPLVRFLPWRTVASIYRRRKSG